MWKRIYLTVFIVVLLPLNILSQRHYKGINGIEANYGLNIFEDNGTFLNVSASKYVNRTTYWKIGLNYFEKHKVYNILSDMDFLSEILPGNTVFPKTCKSYFIDGMYYKTVATNLTSLYFSVGLGAFIGTESYYKTDTVSLSDEHYRFLVGPKATAEFELFLSSRIALLGGLSQYWMPTSKVNTWNTVWNVGFKILIY
jgi:hypothetical protein